MGHLSTNESREEGAHKGGGVEGNTRFAVSGLNVCVAGRVEWGYSRYVNLV